MPSNTQTQQVDGQQLQQQADSKLDEVLAQKKQELEGTQQTEEQTATQQQEPQQQQQVEQPQNTKDASDKEQTEDNELSEYENVLKNTYGVTDEELKQGVSPEKALKMAKSWANMQSKATTAQQEAKQVRQQKEQFDQLLQSNPELYKHAQAVMNGQSYENPKQQGTTHNGQPTKQQGQLDSQSVNEDTLISEGYLSRDQLNGLDDIDRKMAIKEATLDYKFDQKVSNYESQLTQKEENLQKQKEQKQVNEHNAKVLSEGLDKFVRQTGFPIGELDDNTFEQIKNEALYDRQSADPRKIKEDAFQVAAQRVLGRQGKLNNTNTEQTQQSKQQIMKDTGQTVNQAQPNQNRNQTPEDELRQQAKANFANRGGDPKAKYIQ